MVIVRAADAGPVLEAAIQARAPPPDEPEPEQAGRNADGEEDDSEDLRLHPEGRIVVAAEVGVDAG